MTEMTQATKTQDLAGWFAGRLPDDWFTEPAGGDDRPRGDPRGRPARRARLPEGRRRRGQGRRPAPARIKRFREDTREQRMRIADEAEERTGRKVAWGAVCGDERRRVHRSSPCR